MPIYHITSPADWAAAQSTGSYTLSSKGRTLAEEGFIHASQAMKKLQENLIAPSVRCPPLTSCANPCAAALTATTVARSNINSSEVDPRLASSRARGISRK